MSDLERADEALRQNLSAHRCFTSDGMAIICLCIRGEAHDEDES